MIIIVGVGLFGSVCARELTDNWYKVLILGCYKVYDMDKVIEEAQDICCKIPFSSES